MTQSMGDVLLDVRGLRKSFGAVAATQGVDLVVRAGEIHALIGPNGAGKSTLIAQICGEIRPDAGEIRLADRDVTAMPAYERARRGLGRSFQITELCQEYTALENVMLSLTVGPRTIFSIWSDPRHDGELVEHAQAWLKEVGLADRAQVPVADLAHGERRQLELAVALARGPRLLLLDEPMAGMGPDESGRMVELLLSLKGEITMLLVEHDMDAVFRLADRVSTLVFGKVIATGSPEDIRGNPEVRRAYLGDDEAAQFKDLGV